VSYRGVKGIFMGASTVGKLLRGWTVERGRIVGELKGMNK